MRCVQFALILCLGMHGSMVRADELKDQQTDDKQRETVLKLIKKYEAEQRRYGDMSGLRIARDWLSELDHRKNDRATILWQRIGITGPLRAPITPEQLAELRSFIGAFETTKEGQNARSLLVEHEKLVQELLAAAALTKLQLKSEKHELTDLQLNGLVNIEQQFSGTTSASVSKRYLNQHFTRELLKDLANAGLLDPIKAEQLADQRQKKATMLWQGDARWLRWLLRRELAEIVEDYPKTKASDLAKQQLKDLDLADKREAVANRIAAERTRDISEYWDTVYPSRTQKPVALQK